VVTCTDLQMTTSSPAHEPEPTAGPRYQLREMVGYALKLGTIGFGGPVALVGYMHRDLVERRGWISEAEY
jgi:chromate transporter